ncbi:MAG: VOC family protein [Anaerolineae bacterium]
MHPTLGPVHLNVQNLDRQVRFYETIIGLHLHRKTASSAELSAGCKPLLVLHQTAAARPAHRTTGLYHFALLVPDRRTLARVLRHLSDSNTPLHGFADHFVSEAIYLPDAEGNGIEIYRDRPRETWTYRDGRLHIGTAPLDVRDLLTEAGNGATAWHGLPDGTTMGHVHLHVADISATEAFYADLLGMDVMARMSSATFLAWEGYHHHLGGNTWNGEGIPAPPPDAPGLRWYTIHVPDPAAFDGLRARLEAAGAPLQAQDDGFLARDPAGNGILLTSM